MFKEAAIATLLAVALVGFITGAVGYGRDGFEEFKANFGKVYEGEENAYRRAIFRSNMKRILEHNSNPEKSYTMGVNQFADITD